MIAQTVKVFVSWTGFMLDIFIDLLPGIFVVSIIFLPYFL